jgi:bifunctional DNA-binding transcriptional regulator/antitoxin component of YhaV-PrlF toxin-antitoxin module
MAQTKIVRQLRHGQITIPIEFRRELGLSEDRILQMTLTEGELRLNPVVIGKQVADPEWLRKLYEYFAPARAEAIEKGYTEEEINEAIDAAVAAVRAGHD